MPRVDRYEPNTFCWPELSSTDVAAAVAFYVELFGWSTHDDPLPSGGSYTLASLNGANVCGMYQMSPEQRQAGAPSHWASYVSVTSADETAAAIEKAGGTLMMPPFDVMEAGRMCAAKDPAGAAFCIWQPIQHIGSQVVREPGAPTWYELMTTDVDGSVAFYGEVFGWQAETYPGNYTELFARGCSNANGDRALAGLLARPDSLSFVPPHWGVYFEVADVDAATARAAELGGQVLSPPMTIADVARFSTLADPSGGAFAVMKFEGHRA